MPDRVNVRSGLEEEASFRRYISVIRRRMWIILLCFAVVTTAVAIHAAKATPVYEAAASILIEREGPQITNWRDVQEVSSGAREYFETQCLLIRSKEVIQKALEDPELKDLPELKPVLARPSTWTARMKETVKALLGTSPPPLPEPWEILRGLVRVEPIRGTMLAGVKVAGPDPQHITLMANAVARSFEKTQLKRKVISSGEAFVFLQQETEKQRMQLVDAEKALQEFRESISMVPASPGESENPIMTRLARLSKEATDVGLARIELASQHQVIGAILNTSDTGREGQNEQLFSLPAVRADGTVTALRQQLIEREEQLKKLSEIYHENHPVAF